MNHLGTKALESDTLLLRRFGAEDAQAMYDNWANDPEVTKYLMWPHHESVKISKGVLDEWIPRYQENNYYLWAIVPKDNRGVPIGSIGAVKVDDQIEMVRIGCCVGKR